MATQRFTAAPDADTEGEEAKRRARAALMEDFHIKSAYVGVPTLARILGLATSTIYSLMRLGTFCLPHRTVGSTVLVRLDDLVDWHCANDVESLATVERHREAGCGKSPSEDRRGANLSAREAPRARNDHAI